MSDDRPAPATPLYTLVVETTTSGTRPAESREPPARYPIVGRETILGRAPTADVRLDDLFVSREHARLLLRDHNLHLDDLGSTNTTLLNGALVHTRVRVVPGDVIEMGPVRCRIESTGKPAESPADPPPRTDEAGAADAGESVTERVSASDDPSADATSAEGAASSPEAPLEPSSEETENEDTEKQPEDPPGGPLPAIFLAGPHPGEPWRSRLRIFGKLALLLAAIVAVVLIVRAFLG